MINISDDALKEKVKEYFNTDKGKAKLKASGCVVGKDSLRQVAMELKAAITAAFINAQTQDTPHFDDSKVKIEIKEMPDGTIKASIKYPARTLRRYSFLSDRPGYRGHSDSFRTKKQLYNEGGYTDGYTGSGVYDIFGLFTKGYKSAKPAYGYWVVTDSDGVPWNIKDGIYHNKQHRNPNPFITETINRFQAKYPDMIITYPDAWK